jgi:hypothetical protein
MKQAKASSKAGKAGKARMSYDGKRNVEDFISYFRESVAGLKADGLEWTGAGCFILLTTNPEGGIVVAKSIGDDAQNAAAGQASKAYRDALAGPEDATAGGYL